MRKTRDGMRLKGRGELDFLDEPLAALRIGDEGRGQDLECDTAVQARIGGFVDLAHAAGAEPRDDFVRTKARAAVEGHRESASYRPAGPVTRRVEGQDAG